EERLVDERLRAVDVVRAGIVAAGDLLVRVVEGRVVVRRVHGVRVGANGQVRQPRDVPEALRLEQDRRLRIDLADRRGGQRVEAVHVLDGAAVQEVEFG